MPAPVWKPTSVHIEFSSGSFFEGATGYEKDRDGLTPVQVDALEAIHTVPPPAQGLPEDAELNSITVIDADGSAATFGEGFLAGYGGTLAAQALKPFSATFSCFRSKEVVSAIHRGDAPLDPTSIRAMNIMSPDLGCIDGVFVSGFCIDTLFELIVTESATYDIVASPCIGTLSARVFAGDAMTLLASSTAGTNGACFALRYAFTPGRYVIELDKSDQAGCASDVPDGGDVMFRVVPVK